jgi:hypothetical protein
VPWSTADRLSFQSRRSITSDTINLTQDTNRRSLTIRLSQPPLPSSSEKQKTTAIELDEDGIIVNGGLHAADARLPDTPGFDIFNHGDADADFPSSVDNRSSASSGLFKQETGRRGSSTVMVPSPRHVARRKTNSRVSVQGLGIEQSDGVDDEVVFLGSRPISK